MREATGNALLTMMITSIIAVIMIFFVGSVSYSKSFKIKNYIVNELEENKIWNDTLKEEIDSYMKDAGYNVRRNGNKCANIETELNNGSNKNCTYINSNSNYDYCIFLCNNTDNDTSNVINKYYKVVTWMKFEFPVIGDAVKFQVKGETKTFNYFSNIAS